MRDLFLLTQSLYRDGGRGIAKGALRHVSTKVAYTAAAITGTLDVYGEIIPQQTVTSPPHLESPAAMGAALGLINVLACTLSAGREGTSEPMSVS